MAGSRPSDWQWWNSIYQGAKIKISADEWNSFCARINEFRAYKGLASYSFTKVSSGNKISASVVNQAVTAISAIPGHGTLPNSVYVGNPIKASFFNSLQTALNGIG